MGQKVDFDYATKRMLVHSGETDLDVVIDLYSDAKEDWLIDANLSKFRFPFRVVGGDPTVGIQTIEPYFFLQYGWRIKPQEADHQLTLTGNLFVDGGGNPIVETSGEHTVLATQITTITRVPVTEVSGEATATEIADAVWDESMANHVTLATTGAALADTAFQRAVYIDAASGNPGIVFPRGTQGDPVDNMSDAKDIAEARNSNQFRFMSDITISGENISGYFLDAVGVADVAITLGGGCTTQNTDFRDMVLGGTFSGFCTLHDVICSELTDYQGYSYDCIFVDNVTCVAGGAPNLFLHCYGGKGVVTPVEFDIGSTQTVFMGWQGGVKIVNKTGANVTQVGLNNGHVTIDSTCVAGTIIVDGSGSIVADNSGAGCTVLDANLVPVAIWEDPSAIELIANVKRTLGLTQENYYMDQAVYTTYQGVKLLTSARLRTYSVAGSVGTDSDVLATYTITATWSNDELQDYKVVKQ